MATMKIVKPLSIDSPEAHEHIRQNRAREMARLQSLETIIEKGLKSFVEVGNALMEIRDTDLYKKTHSTFESYCRERWGMERAHAYRMIEGARTAKQLSPVGDTPVSERLVRPLTKLSVMQKKEVWKKVNAKAKAEKRKITTKDVQGFVDRVVNPAKDWATPSPAASNVYLAINQLERINPSGNSTLYTHRQQAEAGIELALWVKENFLTTKFEPTRVGSGVIDYAMDCLKKIGLDDPEREDAGLKVLAWIGENLLSVKKGGRG